MELWLRSYHTLEILIFKKLLLFCMDSELSLFLLPFDTIIKIMDLHILLYPYPLGPWNFRSCHIIFHYIRRTFLKYRTYRGEKLHGLCTSLDIGHFESSITGIRYMVKWEIRYTLNCDLLEKLSMVFDGHIRSNQINWRYAVHRF